MGFLDQLTGLRGSPGTGQPAAAGPGAGSYGIGGQVKGAYDLQTLYPAYQRANIEAQSQGQPFPSFAEWLAEQGIPLPANMPR